MPKRTPQPEALRPSRPLPKQRYAELLRDVQALLVTANTAVDQRKVSANWNLGRRIARERLAEQSGYHNAVLRDLCADARIALRTLQYAVKFHDAYPTCPKLPLNWFHYRVLLDHPNAAARARYQQLAINSSLSARQLARQIAQDQEGSASAADAPLPRPTETSYLYLATVEHIVDGDTLDLRIDLGFHTDRRGRFRLAAVDAPEIDTPEGRPARDFVYQRLLSAKTIVVQTLRTDLHGRYVTHLFYSDEDLTIDQCFKQGVHLNNELVEQGHAELV